MKQRERFDGSGYLGRAESQIATQDSKQVLWEEQNNQITKQEGEMVLGNIQQAGTKRYPINEIFGPTIQGEGPLAGTKTWFIRFAGCDWDCSWCDSKYAVNPKYPGWEKYMLTTKEITQQLADLGIGSDDWITLSGGNPALFVDLEFCNAMFPARLAMETQGSIPLGLQVSPTIECLVVSPKPPSSMMASKVRIETIHELVNFRISTPDYTTALKYVIFDEKDLAWVKDLETQLKIRGNVRRYLSVGTPLKIVTSPRVDYLLAVRDSISNRMCRLFEMVLEDPQLGYFTILPQLHVLAWGQKRGV